MYTAMALDARTGQVGYGVIATVQQYTGSHILDGPASTDGYTWYNVHWNGDNDNGRSTGWSASGNDWLVQTDVTYPATGSISSDYYSSRDSGYHEAGDIAND